MKNCTKCNAEIPANSKFCPQCGAKIPDGLASSSPLFVWPGRKVGFLLIAGSVALGYAIVSLQPGIVGDKPDETFSVSKHASGQKSEQTYVSPTLIRLQKAVKASPQSKDAWKALALELSRSIKEGEGDPRKLALDLVDALSQVLQMDPDDKEALLLTADLSFDMKAFTKAKEFYERYLKIEPDDTAAAARYASTLTFLGQYEQSITLLEALIEQDAENFQAYAFLAITYAQKGENDKAREIGEKALAIAPTEEARNRFDVFLNGLGKKKSQEPLVQALQDNPIAGPKLVSTEAEGDTLTAYMTMFPMQMMPEVAKTKFLAALRARRGNYSRIKFIEKEKGTLLGEFDLTKE